jgi:uncharacterized damage-inducible protein DinB
MNKAELIESIIIEHKKLEAALAKLDPEQMETSLSADIWTIKETLVHITFWEQKLLKDHACWKRGDPLAELQGQEGVDAVNSGTLLKAKAIPLQQALEEFTLSFRQIMDWLDALDLNELDRPFKYGMSLGEFIAEDTWKHYAEHLPLLISKRTD